MRLTRIAMLVCLFCCLAVQAQDARSPQVSAATSDATDSLERQILASSIDAKLTVRDLLDRVGGTDALEKALRETERLGGPRWLDDQTVQVQLVIDGRRVADALLQAARRNAKQSPIPIQRLQRELSTWGDRTFSAIGTSTSAANIERLRPPPADPTWQGVSDADRSKALVAARDNLIARVFDSLRPIRFDSGKTLDEALAIPDVRDGLAHWLSSRPVKSVEFEDDRSVRLTLYAPADELWSVLQSGLMHQKQLPTELGQAGWDRLAEQVTARVAPAVGVGSVQPTTNPAPVAVALPAQAPKWANQQAEAEATSPAQGTKLQTARAAEALAVERLRQQIDSLSVADLTVGEAAHRDPAIAEAISRAMGRARPYKVDYGHRGAVTVHVALNLADLWAELTGQQ